jgi:hypothetical protein
METIDSSKRKMENLIQKMWLWQTDELISQDGKNSRSIWTRWEIAKRSVVQWF